MDIDVAAARGGLRLLLDHLGSVGDPREPCKVKYPLREMLFLVTCATIDAGKKITRRKRHILTETDGRLLAMHVHGADIQDRHGGKACWRSSARSIPSSSVPMPMAAMRVALSIGRRPGRTLRLRRRSRPYSYAAPTTYDIRPFLAAARG